MHDLRERQHGEGKLEEEEDQQHENGQILCEHNFFPLTKMGAQPAQEENFPTYTWCDFPKPYHCLK